MSPAAKISGSPVCKYSLVTTAPFGSLSTLVASFKKLVAGLTPNPIITTSAFTSEPSSKTIEWTFPFFPLNSFTDLYIFVWIPLSFNSLNIILPISLPNTFERGSSSKAIIVTSTLSLRANLIAAADSNPIKLPPMTATLLVCFRACLSLSKSSIFLG